MAGKILYRERTKADKGEKGEKKPGFLMVAVARVDLRFHAGHVRKTGLEAIAREPGAELIFLGRHEEGNFGEEDVEVEWPRAGFSATVDIERTKTCPYSRAARIRSSRVSIGPCLTSTPWNGKVTLLFNDINYL